MDNVDNFSFCSEKWALFSKNMSILVPPLFINSLNPLIFRGFPSFPGSFLVVPSFLILLTVILIEYTTVFYFGGNFAGTILFHNTDAGLYIRTLSFICPFLYTNIALTSILNGLGKTGTTLVHSVLGILLRISFVIFAIPVLGIRGYLYGLLLSEILLSLLHIYALYHMEF